MNAVVKKKERRSKEQFINSINDDNDDHDSYRVYNNQKDEITNEQVLFCARGV